MIGSLFIYICTIYTPNQSIPRPKVLRAPKPHQLHPQLLGERLAHVRDHGAEAPHPFPTTTPLPMRRLLLLLPLVAPLSLPPPAPAARLWLGRRDGRGVVRDRGGGGLLARGSGAALEDGFDPLVGAVRALVG